VFLVTALFGAALFALAWVRLPESASRAPTYSEEKRLPKQRLQTLLRSRAFLGYAMQSSLHFAAFFAFASAASYLMVNVLNRAATEYGLWLVVPAVTVGAGLKAADSLSTRVRSGVLALTGSVFVLAGMTLFMVLLATGPLSTPVLFLPAALSAFGIGLALPATNAGVMSVAPDQAGTASGLLSAMNLLCAAVFAQLVAQDESRTATLLATLGVAGGALSVAFGLLSVGDRGPDTRREVHA
jgi:DHA1 family bicyclomycin/chloramphenicol resistance-like MFS transporter